MRIISYLFVFVWLVLFVNQSKAQVSIEVKLDTNMLLIGDQTDFVLQATFPKDVDVIFPFFTDTVIEKLEILNVSSIDTVMESDRLIITQRYLVTSFDSGWYEIPPCHFGLKWANSDLIDTISSNSVYFGIITMPLDTANADAITDIKKPLGAPITFKEIRPYLGALLAYLILFFLAYFIYKRFIKKEPIFVKKEKPKEPAHLIALRGLDALKENKLWQQGKNKAYYSELTNVIRTYIEDRYFIPAMEQTTDEIVESFKALTEIDKELKGILFETLKQADFVKFAKANTLPEENERGLRFAYDFVAKTKITVVLEDEENQEAVDTKGRDKEDHSLFEQKAEE